jgi:hypothetical protein
MTPLDTRVTTMRPKAIPPPPPKVEDWYSLLSECTSGLWYRVRVYPSAATARQVASRERRRAKNLTLGTWEMRFGPTEGGYGVWARNLQGERLGEDE